ncbi:MAG: DinB family protein [Chloroflexota bacterium]|nr:DinB family protein [Chloroflexota bacterium]
MAALSRQEAVAVLEAGQRELDAVFDRLSAADLEQPGALGDWAAKDLFGHIALWEELALQAMDALRSGREPARGGESADEINARNHAEQAGKSAAELRARAASAHQALLAALRSLSDEEWQAMGDRLGGILGAPGRPFGHAYAHIDDLRAYAQRR